MARTGRPGLSAEQKRELWSRWKAGQSLSDIGRGLGKHAGSVFGVLAAHGGIMPTPRRRSVLCLGSGEREEISRGLVADFSFRQIAAQLGRPALTISREVSRNGGRRQYRATMAEGRAWHQALRPKPYLLAASPDLRSIVAAKLQDQWSPQQISGWLKIEHSHDRMMQVSHETIYKSLFIQARGVLKRELIAHLRSRRVMRRGKTSTAKGQPRGQIIDAISIRQRPADIEDRAVPGHREGDLISGSRNSHVATLVERHSRFVMLVHVNEQGQRQRRQCFNPAGPISTRRHDVVADLGSWSSAVSCKSAPAAIDPSPAPRAYRGNPPSAPSVTSSTATSLSPDQPAKSQPREQLRRQS